MLRYEPGQFSLAYDRMRKDNRQRLPFLFRWPADRIYLPHAIKLSATKIIIEEGVYG
jgi:hypothetical protein